MSVLLDTGVIYALSDRDDAWHERAKSLLDQHLDSFLVPTIVALAERLNIRQIATTDRRDFCLVRPRHCAAFELLP